MTSHGRDYPSAQDVIIPWNRRYTFPTIANKAEKVTSRIQPKTQGPFIPGNVIQVDFPAQGYLNPVNTFLEFDVDISGETTGSSGGLRFENNIQSIFSRCEIKYGSTPLEDISRSNNITRALTEWTATAGQTFDQTSINEGIGNVTCTSITHSGTGANLAPGLVNIRQKYIQGVDGVTAAIGSFGTVNRSRRYCVQPIAGMLQQRKLIPVKYMANQLSLILTLAQPVNCMFGISATAGTYTVSNVNLICETLNFDPTFDENFLEGLRQGGVPIKFASWRSYGFSTEQNNNFQIAERAKSVKSLFAVLKRSNPTLQQDSGAMPFMPATDHTMLEYQYQVGTKYYPASPVVTGSGVKSNGGAEAYIELAKALYTVGNYQLSSAVNALRWGHSIYGYSAAGPWTYSGEAEQDFEKEVVLQQATSGGFQVVGLKSTVNVFGQAGSQCFAQAISLETAASADYSGLNAEEASTIILRNKYSAKPGAVAAGGATETAFDTIVFTYIDKMIVLGENNTITLLE